MPKLKQEELFFRELSRQVGVEEIPPVPIPKRTRKYQEYKFRVTGTQRGIYVEQCFKTLKSAEELKGKLYKGEIFDLRPKKEQIN